MSCLTSCQTKEIRKLENVSKRLKLSGDRAQCSVPSAQSSFQKTTFVIAVQNSPEPVIKVFCSCLILLDFFTLLKVQKRSSRGVLQKRFSQKFYKIHRKTPVPESQRPQVCNFIKKETLAQVFSCEFCEISSSTIFTEHPRPTASISCPRLST